jgi:hypothetical protein
MIDALLKLIIFASLFTGFGLVLVATHKIAVYSPSIKNKHLRLLTDIVQPLPLLGFFLGIYLLVS